MGGPDSRFEFITTPKFVSLERREEDCSSRLLVYLSIPCAYTRVIVEDACRRNKDMFSITANQNAADIQWADYEELDWDTILEGKVRANSYLIRKGLSRKAQLCHYMNKFVSKNPSSVLRKAVPDSMAVETWEAFEGDMTFLGAKFDRSMVNTVSQRQRLEWALADAKSKMQAAPQGTVWILKPSVTNKGAEIFILRDFDVLADAVQEWPDVREWVLQRYIDRPLLFRKAKFHLRVYVLAVGDLAVYVYDGMLLLCSGVPYDGADITNTLAHITNTACQAESRDFVEEECVFLLEDLVDDLHSQGHHGDDAPGRVQKLRQDIRDITGDLFRALHGERTVFSPVPNCFELFGLDFMVDESFQVYLLEANPGPDFKQTGGRLKRVIEGLMLGTIDIALRGEEAQHEEAAFVKVYEDRERGAKFHQNSSSGGGGGMRLFN